MLNVVAIAPSQSRLKAVSAPVISAKAARRSKI